MSVRTVTIETVRIMSSGSLWGVACAGSSWWVYSTLPNEKEWMKHCGPYSDRESAADWINAIRDAAPSPGASHVG